MLLVILVLVILILVYQLLKSSFTYWEDRGVKQTKPVILFGDNWGLILRLKSFTEQILDIYNEHSEVRYSGFYQFHSPNLIIKDPDLLKELTVKDFDHFPDHRTIIPEESDPLWALNLFALKGKKWREMRSTLSPSFTSCKMKYMFNLITETAENFVSYFKNLNEETVEVELKDTFTRFTNDVIATTAFGIKVDSLALKDNNFYLMGQMITNFRGLVKVLKIFGFLSIPRVLKFFRVTFFEKEVTNFFIGLTTETIKVRVKKKITRPDLIHLLMEARKGYQKPEVEDTTIDEGFAVVQESEIGKRGIKRQLEDIDIAAQAMIFFLAGFETVSSLMCFLGYELAVNPDVQERLRGEIREALEECDGKVTYEAILKMQYLDQVVSEALRKWPPLAAIDRICAKPYTIKATQKDEIDVHLPLGTGFWMPIIGLHRDPKFYPNPDIFDPERFSEENKSKIKPYTYLPFGVGPRGCIGSRFALLETKVVYFYLLNSFQIVSNDKSTIPLQIDKKHLNLHSKNGFLFSFKRLNN